MNFTRSSGWSKDLLWQDSIIFSVERPLELPVERPVEWPAEQPVERPAELPVEQTVERPVNNPSSTRRAASSLCNRFSPFESCTFFFMYPRGAALFNKAKRNTRTGKRGLEKVGYVRCGQLHRCLVVFRSWGGRTWRRDNRKGGKRYLQLCPRSL